MYSNFISDKGTVGSVIIRTKDDGLVFMYSTNEGKVFKKSYDNGRTFSDTWTVPLGSVTANSNLIELKDGTWMMPLKHLPENEIARKMLGADFSVVFSSDEGRTWSGDVKVNRESGCNYLMNARLLRLKSERILMPICYHPNEILDITLFEKSGYSGCYYSDDEGQSWEHGQWVKGDEAGGMLAEPIVVEDNDNKVLMYMRTGTGYLYKSESLDMGETFSTEKPTTLRSPNAPFCVAKDPYSGKIFAVWDNAFPAIKHQYPRCPICIAVSVDGDKWDFIMELGNDPSKNYGYPALYFTEDEILVTYYVNKDRNFSSKTNRQMLNILKRDDITVRKYYEEKLNISKVL